MATMTNSRHMADHRHDNQKLNAIGIPPVDSQIYTTLISHPRTTAADLAEHCGLSTQQVARGLARLTASAMASRVPGRPARYLAAAPDIALGELVAAKAAEVKGTRATIAELMEVFREASRFTHPAELVEVVTGADNISNRVSRLHECAREQIRFFDRPPYVDPPGGNHANEHRRLTDGIRYRVIYDREAIAVPGRLHNDILVSLAHGEHSRARPTLPIKMLMADEQMAAVPISSSPHVVDAAYLIHPSALLDALVTLFEAEWARAVPLAKVIGDDQPEQTDDAETGTLLTLLAAGQTDAGIARALGWSPRTVQRRIQRLMHNLNATTRFQAGMNAKERGLL
jgi:Sugar-specific transcriptional regulator TrmB/Bacterial regulatory proteins, luxR family